MRVEPGAKYQVARRGAAYVHELWQLIELKELNRKREPEGKHRQPARRPSSEKRAEDQEKHRCLEGITGILAELRWQQSRISPGREAECDHRDNKHRDNKRRVKPTLAEMSGQRSRVIH